MQRPTSITVIAILNIVFGVLGFCCSVAPAGIFVMPPDSPMLQGNPNIELIQQYPLYRAYFIAVAIVGAVASLGLIVGGIGLLMNQAWGRTASIAWGFYGIVMGAINLAMNMIYVAPLTAQQAQAEQTDPAAATGALVGSHVGMFCCGLFAFIYPVVLLVFMYRRATVDFFSGVSTGVDENTWDPGAPV